MSLYQTHPRRIICCFGDNHQGRCLVDPRHAGLQCRWPAFVDHITSPSSQQLSSSSSCHHEGNASSSPPMMTMTMTMDSVIGASCGFSSTAAHCRSSLSSSSSSSFYNNNNQQQQQHEHVDRLVITGHFIAHPHRGRDHHHHPRHHHHHHHAATQQQQQQQRRQSRMTRQYVDLRRVWQLTSTSSDEPVHLQRFPGAVGAVKQISVGNSHLLVLNQRGQVFVTGDDATSTAVDHIEEYYHEPSATMGAAGGGRGFSMDLEADLEDELGQIPGQHLRLFYHTRLAQYEPIRFINASFRYSIVIGTDPNDRNRTVVLSFGSDNYGNLGCSAQHRRAINEISYPQRADDVSRDDIGEFVKVASGFAHVITLTSSGRCFSHGYGYHGELATSRCEERDKPVEITHMFGGQRIRDISCGTFHSVFLTEDNRIYMCGRNVEYQCSHFADRDVNDSVLMNSWNHSGSVLAPVRVDLGVPIRMIEACGKSTIAITEDDRVFLTGCHFESSRSSPLRDDDDDDDNDEHNSERRDYPDGQEIAITERALASLTLSDHVLLAQRRFRFTHIDIAQYCPSIDLTRYRIRSVSSGDSHVALTFEEKPGVDTQLKLHTLLGSFSDISIVCGD